MNKDILAGLYRWFDGYTAPYLAGSRANAPLRLKAEHCRRVAAEIVDIARHETLDGDELVTAEAAGLFHDVGRFEQYEKFTTFVDRRSLDHAALAVDVLERSGALADLPHGERERVTTAIRWHNAIDIPRGLGEREERLALLLRDADKLDIYRVVLEYFEDHGGEKNATVELDLPDLPEISGEIVVSVLAAQPADYRRLRTVNDFKVLMMGWARDLRFRRTRELVRERGYVRRLFELLPKTGAVIDAYRAVNSSLEYPGPLRESN